MFIGEYLHKVDEKGRVAIPYRFRKLLREGAIVAKGLLDRCLCLYPKTEWERLSSKISQLPISDPKARAFSRLIFSQAVEVGFDRQGRILLPSFLREYAGIKDEAVIAGVHWRAEIWNKKAWEEYKQQSEKASTDISKHLEGLNF